ncbi:hypothetical protein LTR40_012151 [Exophiala xenobiotica]|nr:hypothetical protein LTR40_012151 [Exophiala xenobiotica]
MDIADTPSPTGHNFVAAIQLWPLARCMGAFYLHALMRLLFLSHRMHSKAVKMRLLHRLFELRRLWDAFWTVL